MSLSETGNLHHKNPTLEPFQDNPDDQHRHKGKKWAAGVALVGLTGLGIGGIVATRNGNSPSDRRTEVATPTNGGKTGTKEAASGQEKSSSFGNINVGRVHSSDNLITATRPNGETIKVPRLRSTDNETDFAESALALLACYLTTGSQECLDSFSPNSDIQGSLEKWYREDILPVLSSTPLNKDMQVAIFDSPNDPAEFSRDADGAISLAHGTIYFGRYIDLTGTNRWQDEGTRAQGGLEQRIESIRFFDKTTADGSPIIDGFIWNTRPNN